VIIEETRLAGAFVIEIEPLRDERGFFARTFDRELFEQQGLAGDVIQSSVSFNDRAGTLRGMHYQAEPHGEEKLVRCTRGAVLDVIVDLRPESPTYCEWLAVELDEHSHRALYIPRGVAHGFQTLVDASELLYQMSTPYVPGAGRGVRWDDPAFGVEWPEPPAGRIMSERDRTYPDFAP
jgi:dTDP-4-dehydrorhamnose 3,5-epimerase